MKYRFIQQYQGSLPVATISRLLGVSRSAYYRSQQGQISTREQVNQVLVPEIRSIHQKSDGSYGSPRIWETLRDRGIRCGRKRVARLMRLHGIRAKTTRRFKITTRSRKGQFRAPDLLGRKFSIGEPNRVWTSDITFIWTREGWTYLAVVLDLYSRMIVGWELSSRPTGSLVTIALERALELRQPPVGLILHSDRGTQYTSTEIRELAKERGIQLSMGRKGDCYDNAVTESFFHTLKIELTYFRRYDTRLEASTSIFAYIEAFYNSQRKHSSIGNLSPMQYESLSNIP
jgi:putative transposase